MVGRDHDPVVGIVGLGLIGGSVGLALRGKGTYRVVGYDKDEKTRARALKLGICDSSSESLASIAGLSDILVIAVPTGAIPEVALEAARFMRPGSVLTDVGSAKAPTLAKIREGLIDGISYVGGHPMAGSERSGLEAASAALFRGAVWALTADLADERALGKVVSLVRACGAEPLLVEAGQHDEAVAFTSHLPYFLALSLALTCRDKAADLPILNVLNAGGFRGATRLALSEPSVAMDYCLENAEALLPALDEFETRLRRLKVSLSKRDGSTLMSMAAIARTYLYDTVGIR